MFIFAALILTVMLNKENYLVLFDFSKSAENALMGALSLANQCHGTVQVLHVIKSNLAEQQALALQQMSTLKKTIPGTYETSIIVGNLIEIINDFTINFNIDYVIMGTHGVKGSQKLLGSNALKLVSSGKAPFLITQEHKTLNTIKNIVLPFSFSSESLQIGKVVAHLANRYNAKIHLVGYRDNDEWLRNDMVRNQAIIKRQFSEQKANFEIVKLNIKKSFEKELIEFANSVSADLIAAAYFSGSRLIIRKNFVRDMITNSFEIPVLTINAESLKKIGNYSSI